MTIPKPNHERFDMTLEEHMAFWFIIIPEYSHSQVRRDSLRLYKNTSLIRTDDNG